MNKYVCEIKYSNGETVRKVVKAKSIKEAGEITRWDCIGLDIVDFKLYQTGWRQRN